MLNFCLRSFFTEYGRQFLWRLALPHPIKTMRAALLAEVQNCSGEKTTISHAESEPSWVPGKNIVGAGFCLKPLQPECLSGRFNHDCYFLENAHLLEQKDIPLPCQQCTIRTYGIAAHKAGCAFYIMTSAHDILFDLFKPAADYGVFSCGIFTLCRFSLKPFAVGMRIAGIQGWMFPFNEGDCRDYQTWLKADRGTKTEQTLLPPSVHEAILALLCKHETTDITDIRFEKRDNIFYPSKKTP